MKKFGVIENLMPIGVILFFIITIHNTSKYGASLSWMIPACFVIFLGYFFSPNLKVGSTPLALLCFWLTILISTLLSPVVSVQQDIFSFAVLLFVFFLVSRLVFEEQQVRSIINAYIFSSLICAFFIVKNWLAGDFYVSWTLRASYRFLGEYKDPNYVSAYMCPAVFFLYLKVIFSRTMKNKIINFIMLLVLFLGVLCTGSRAPVIAIGFGMILFYVMDDNLSILKKVAILILGALFLLFIYRAYTYVMPEQVFERIQNSLDDSRKELWTAGLKGFTENFIIGSGLNSSNYFSNLLVGNYCHNVFIDVLSSCGVVGCLFLLHVFVRNCVKACMPNLKFMLSSIIVFFLPLFFINGFNSATFITPLMFMSILSNYCKIDYATFINLVNK